MSATQPSLALLRFASGDIVGAVATIFDCQFKDPDGTTDARGIVATVRELVTTIHTAGYPREAERVRQAALAYFNRAERLGAQLELSGGGAPGASGDGEAAGAGKADGAPNEAGDASGMEWLLPEDFRERDLLLEPGSTLAIQLEQAANWIKNAGRYRILDLDCPTGLLFEGPTGTGKTTAAHYLGWKIGRPVGIARHDALASRFVGQNLKNLRACIEASVERGALLMFDEVDALARDRRLAGPTDTHRIEMTNSFLEQLSLLRRNHPEHVVITATNHPEVLDDAFVRRVAHTIRFDFLGAEARAQLLEALYTQVDVEDEARELLVARSAERSGDFLRSVAMTAARAATDELGEAELAAIDAHRAAQAEAAADGSACGPTPPNEKRQRLPPVLPQLPRPRVLRAHVVGAIAVVRDQADAREKARARAKTQIHLAV